MGVDVVAVVAVVAGSVVDTETVVPVDWFLLLLLLLLFLLGNKALKSPSRLVRPRRAECG